MTKHHLLLLPVPIKGRSPVGSVLRAEDSGLERFRPIVMCNFLAEEVDQLNMMDFITQGPLSITHTGSQGDSLEKQLAVFGLVSKIHSPGPRLDQNKTESQVSLLG